VKFISVEPKHALGAVLAHSLRLQSGKRLRKGVAIDPELISKLEADGIARVTIARAQAGDVSEDEAARKMGCALASPGLRIADPATGRVNVFAERAGLFIASSAKVNGLNHIDEGLTLATLPDCSAVEAGRLVATVKVIPYFLPNYVLEKALTLDLSNTVGLLPFTKKRVALISTTSGALKESAYDATRRALETRLKKAGARLVQETRVAHSTGDLSAALSMSSVDVDIIIVFGVSAISDRADIIPSSLEGAGGRVIRLGMPVDPGNLLMLGELSSKPVIGAPGCARSPVENGFDWVLNRLLAGMDPGNIDISHMGVGGLLMETVSRPSPREEDHFRPAAIVLAAGQSARMGNVNKLTMDFSGKPMVRHVVGAAQAMDEVVVVTGHDSQAVVKALSGLPFDSVFNENYASGMASSLKAGLDAMGPDITHACVLLGDMPLVTVEHVAKLLDAARQEPATIVVGSSEGKRGNPVVWPRSYFPKLATFEGDVGGRALLDAERENLTHVELGSDVHKDYDTPDSF